METTKTQSPYFLSMADLLIGVLFIFLIIMFYFALNFSEFAKFAKEYEKDKNLIATLSKENEDLKSKIEELTAENKKLDGKLDNAIKRAEAAEKRATEIENFILSVNETKIEIL